MFCSLTIHYYCHEEESMPSALIFKSFQVEIFMAKSKYCYPAEKKHINTKFMYQLRQIARVRYAEVHFLNILFNNR